MNGEKSPCQEKSLDIERTVWYDANIVKRSLLQECLSTSRNKQLRGNHPDWEGYNIYSFLVQKNKILSCGFNRMAENPLNYGYESYSNLHAEVDAWKKAKGIMDRSLPFELINIRWSKGMRIRISKPCVNCYELLSSLGCRRFYFTTNEQQFEIQI